MKHYFIVVLMNTPGGEHVAKALHRTTHDERWVRALVLNNWFQHETEPSLLDDSGNVLVVQREDGTATATITEIREIPEIHFNFLTSFGYLEEI